MYSIAYIRGGLGGGHQTCAIIKFNYSKKATKFCKISILLLTGTT